LDSAASSAFFFFIGLLYRLSSPALFTGPLHPPIVRAQKSGWFRALFPARRVAAVPRMQHYRGQAPRFRCLPCP
jgi:hypothetical protein